MKRTIYIDITQFERGRLNTGIQRVLKEFLQRALQEQSQEYVILIASQKDPQTFLSLCKQEVKAFLADVANYRFEQEDVIDIFAKAQESALKPIFFDMDSAWNAPYKRTELYPRLKAAGFFLWNFLYDFVPVVKPEYAHAATQKNFTHFLEAFYAHSDMVFFDSHAAYEDFYKLQKKFAPSRHIPSRVIGLGADFFDRLPAKPTDPQITKLLATRYILFVGTLEPRKSQSLMLDAFEKLAKRYKDLHLIFIAKKGWSVEDLAQRIENHSLYNKRLHWLQNIDDAALAHFYNNAFIVSYLSKYEGYGLPVAESLGYGNITITSKNSSIYEVGRDFADYIHYESAKELEEIVALYLNDSRLYRAKKEFIAKNYVAPRWDAFYRSLALAVEKFETALQLRQNHRQKLQFVFISIEKESLEATLKTIDANVDFVKEYIIVTAPHCIDAMKTLQSRHPIEVIDERVILGSYAADFAKRDHQSKNWLLRASLLQLENLDDEFIMLDDDNQILRPLTLQKFINPDGSYNCYYFYNLLEWTHKGTEYDKGQHNTKDLLSRANYELFSYSSHAPQIINKQLLQESVGEFFEAGLKSPVDEWSSYFNRSVAHYPYLFNKRIVETLNWPESPYQWEHLYQPEQFSFENYYKNVYTSGFFTPDLSYAEKIRRKKEQVAPFLQSRSFFEANRSLLASQGGVSGVVSYHAADVTLHLLSLPHFVVVVPKSDIRLKLNYKIHNPKEQALDIELLLVNQTRNRTVRKFQGLTTASYQESRIEFPLISTGLAEGSYNFSFELNVNGRRVVSTPAAKLHFIVAKNNTLQTTQPRALQREESLRTRLKKRIKALPFFGWMARWSYNLLRLNNIKHRLFVSEHRLSQLEEGVRALQEQVSSQQQIIVQQQKQLHKEQKAALQQQQNLQKEFDKKFQEQNKKLQESAAHIQTLLRHNHTHHQNYAEVRATIRSDVRKEIQELKERLFATIADLQNTTISQEPSQPQHSTTTLQQRLQQEKLNDYYLSFEERFRGSQELITQRAEEYLSYLDPEVESLLDIGCGRGEWVGLLQRNSIDAMGIDLNEAMLAAGRKAGVKNLRAIDAFAFFKESPADSFDCITAFHIVEHIPFEQLFYFFEELRRIAKPNAQIFIETPNPANIMVGAYTFYKDPTHLNPLPSEVIAFMMEHLGFGDLRVEFLHPFDPQQRLSETTQTARRFNSYFYREQDYLIVAKNVKRSATKPQAANKPKLAYIAPYIPQKTGIAWYSKDLIPALEAHYEVELINDEVTDAPLRVRTTAWFRANHSRYDRILYHFGNSAYHKQMIDLLAAYPGVVLLHDFYLSNLMAKAGRIQPNCAYQNHGYKAVQYLQQEGMAAFAWHYPCNRSILQDATGIITHSHYSLALTNAWYYGFDHRKTASIAMPKADHSKDEDHYTLAELGFEEDAFLVCSFGLVGESKETAACIAAWLDSPLSAQKGSYLVIVGENDARSYGEAIAKQIEPHANIIITGWVDDKTFRSYLHAASVAVQLRRRSRGETSAALLDVLLYGIATITNANGSIAELPGDILWMLPDNFTHQELTTALTTLAEDRTKRQALAAKARAYMQANHNERDVAADLCTKLEHFYAHPLPYKAVHARQILVDVSSIVRHDLRTGIQRVVRSQLRELIANAPQNYRIEAVYLNEDAAEYYYARSYTKELLGISELTLPDEPVELFAGDIFYGLDLSAKEVAFATKEGIYTRLKEAGVAIYFMVYDLLPLLHPEFFPPYMEAKHKEWLENICATGAKFITISAAVASQMQQLCKDAECYPIHLGSHILQEDAPRERHKSQKPRFLMVGTLEPRKGHRLVLAAFDRLWQEGLDVELVIVGKRGWMMEPFFKEMQYHPEYAKRLLYKEFVSDSQLAELYRDATALILASQAEGFGLPLIEAAHYGLPLIVRDIAVFREVAGKHAFYFDAAADVAKLAEALKAWLQAYERGTHPRSHAMPRKSWQENALEILALFAREQ